MTTSRRSAANPRITLRDAEAIKRFSPLVRSVMAESKPVGPGGLQGASAGERQHPGVSAEYVNFSSYDAERGRLLSPSEVERNRNVVLLGWGTADRLFGQGNPLDKIIKIEGIHFRVIGVNEKKGAIFGQSQDEFAVVPLGAFQKLSGPERASS